MNQPEISALLKKFGLKCTPARQQVLTLLSTTDEPRTADELFAKLLSAGHPASLSTVYRILDALTGAGILAVSTFEGKKYYAMSEQHTHYFRCLNCNHRVRLEHCPLEQYEQQLQTDMGLFVTEHHLELTGYCASCQKKEHE